MPNVQLKVDGNIYDGWTKINIMQSFDAVASTFELELANTWSSQNQAPLIRSDSACELWLNDQKIITGYVDLVLPQYDAKSHVVVVSGRSKTADLVDCSLPTSTKTEFKNQTFTQVATSLCKHFDIKVIDNVGLTEPTRIQRWEPGETVFEYLEKYARSLAVRLVSDADGNLVITRASDTKIKTALVLGENIVSGQGNFSSRDRFSEYHVTGQQQGWGDNNAENSAHVLQVSKDEMVRYRPTVIVAENALDKKKAARRAEHQRNVNYGRSRSVVYTYIGWQHSDAIWAINHLVNVTDKFMGISNEWLMISSVNFLLDDNGQRTEITVMPKEAFDLVPLPIEDEGGW